MKKLFTLIACALCYISVSAQTWDFTSGLSDATKANLAADATNWASNRTDVTTGVTTGWKNAKALSDGTTLTANGQTIAEFEGIIFNKCSAGNILLDPTSFRLGGKSETITLKAVQNGQTITIKAKSANSTAENRALISSTEGVTYISGPTDGICYGGSATSETAIAELANAENGVFTLVWTVETESEDGIDVTIGTGSASGGIDIQSIKLSGGSAEEDKNVAWVSANPDGDTYRFLAPTSGVQYTGITSDTELTEDELRSYDAVVISTDVTEDSPMGKLLADNISFVPMVNLNTNLFGYTPANVANTRLKALKPGHDIFTGVEISEEDSTFDYTNIAVALPERFASDDILATNEDAVAIHQHNAKRNTYILIPSDAEGNVALNAQTSWVNLMANAITMAASTKKAVTKVSKPVVSQSYADGETTVSISCATTGAKIIYAIDDADFQPYSEPFKMTAEGTVWAYATAEGYIPMTPDEAIDTPIKVYTPTTAPQISYDVANDTATITITADEGASIYYNFTGDNTTAASMQYTEALKIAENVTVTAFAVKDGYLNSATTSKTISIPGYVPMSKVIAHFDANKAEWANGESKTYYYCYLKGDNQKKYPLSEKFTCEYSDSATWTLRTSGQQVVWESTSPQKNVGDVSNYNPVRVTDLIDCNITGGEITFGSTGSSIVYAEDGVTALQKADGSGDSTVTDKPSAELVSIVKFQGPFSITTYIGCKPGKQGFEYLVSTDGEKWDSIAVSPAGPTYEDAASKWRLWHRDVISYTGTDQVYLKLKSISTDSYRIFDVYVNGKADAIEGDYNNDQKVDVCDVNIVISNIISGTATKEDLDKVVDIILGK